MAGTAFDFKKEYRDLYLPGTRPARIEVPVMPFIMVAGKGDPNAENAEYARAMEILYGLSFTIKMTKMSGDTPVGYFDYVVPPLEGLWWIDGWVFDGTGVPDKSRFTWVSMIRQPDFVTREVFEWACAKLSAKKPALDLAGVRFEAFEEGLCAQIMHCGPYDGEPATIEKLEAFIAEAGYTTDISDAPEAFPLARRHHEIYLGDPRKCKPENLRTVIRHPIRKA